MRIGFMLRRKEVHVRTLIAILVAAAALGCHAETPTQYSFILENDKWGHPKSDRDYTMGVALSAVQDVDKSTSHWITLGSTTFTPQRIEAIRPLPDDRPYAELLYLGFGRVEREGRFDVEKEIRVGVLGTNVGRYVQTFIHEHCNCRIPLGWDNQIGQGGSPTFLIRRHWNLPFDWERHRVVFGAGGEAGYYVRGVVTAAFMFGWTRADVDAMRIGGPVSRPAPMAPMSAASNADASTRVASNADAMVDTSSTPSHSRGFGFWVQYEGSAFAYDELLQGAWSGSNRVKIAYRDIEHFQQHANLGVDVAFIPRLLPLLRDKEFHIYFTQSWRSADLKLRNQPRNHYWGGLTLSLLL